MQGFFCNTFPSKNDIRACGAARRAVAKKEDIWMSVAK